MRALLALGLLATATTTAACGSDGPRSARLSDTDAGKVLIDRNWMDRWPEQKDDRLQLYRFTPLQTSFGVNMVALNGGRPEQLALKDILSSFVAFREEVVSRRTKFLLNKARERAHVLVGLAIAVANIDEVIALIRASSTTEAGNWRSLGWPSMKSTSTDSLGFVQRSASATVGSGTAICS